MDMQRTSGPVHRMIGMIWAVFARHLNREAKGARLSCVDRHESLARSLASAVHCAIARRA
jgi:hypothetical protein